MYTLTVNLINGNSSSFDFFTLEEAQRYRDERKMDENRCILSTEITDEKTFMSWVMEKRAARGEA